MELTNHWSLRENQFCPEHVRKYESVFCQGNGYMGIRAAVEEETERNCRYTLVAGTFDRREDKNTTELPNSADVMALELTADGCALAVTPETAADYCRELDLHTGLLKREFVWKPRAGAQLFYRTERFVSLAELHTACQRLVLENLREPVVVTLRSGIRADGRHGPVHFTDGQAREEDGILQYMETTHESSIDFVTGAAIRVWHCAADGSMVPLAMQVEQRQERILGLWHVRLQPGESLIMEKLCRIATTRDRDADGFSGQELLERELESIRALAQAGYDRAQSASKDAWKALWQQRDVQITARGDAPIPDQLALRFAVYHLTCMAPLHDNRMNIGAKGLSGRGYMGHSFWDTEVYMLPYFIWEDPKGARSLLEYRYLCLPAARENAAHYGYAGARFPWEAAWITHRETCPEDHFSKHELHVSADVAYGVYAYYAITGDMDFMRRCGCQLLFETAQFWCSRLEYNADQDRFEIRDVIGPDEFTHEANNNAFTNYLAHLNLRQAVLWAARLQAQYPGDYARLDTLLKVTDQVPGWQEGADKLYLPLPGDDGILPQDDDYFTLPTIDLTPYRQGLRKLRKDYPYPTYTRLRVSKQADVMNLFLLMDGAFTDDVKRASLAYYEPYCVHESSLSLCAYSMLAADCGQMDMALELFQRAKAIDLGPDMRSSDEGIHAASLGGIWQCCVLGFAGVRLCGEELRVQPHLPPHWEKVTAQFCWQGSRILLTTTQTRAQLQVLEGEKRLRVFTGSELLEGWEELSWQYGEEKHD